MPNGKPQLGSLSFRVVFPTGLKALLPLGFALPKERLGFFSLIFKGKNKKEKEKRNKTFQLEKYFQVRTLEQK